MDELPEFAAWHLVEAHDGFDVVFLDAGSEGYHVNGYTAGVEAGEAWGISYSLELDAGWATRSARVRGHTASGDHETVLEGDGAGEWLVDGESAPEIAGCLDVDLEGSAFTNALPIHRLALAVGQPAKAPAAYVRAHGLTVERLDQTYARLDDDGDRSRYDYASPSFSYRGELVYDRFGLVITYPGIAERVA
ncbi:MAG TPA: putative glycolipid-binding domain-containing protein [Solirubrobacterales bacterium]|nr:putative glycolipid-binding domain-containing protein [Solirubrobacterales bacterium]